MKLNWSRLEFDESYAFRQIKEQAELFGLSIESAIEMRTRYLNGLITQVDSVRQTIPDHPQMDVEDWPGKVMFVHYADGQLSAEKQTVEKAITRINDEYKFSTRPFVVRGKQRLTQEEISMARSLPITKVMDFSPSHVGPVAFCPFHQDKKPSLVLNKKTNNRSAHCFPCNREVTAIDIVQLDAPSGSNPFIWAVRKILATFF